MGLRANYPSSTFFDLVNENFVAQVQLETPAQTEMPIQHFPPATGPWIEV